MQTLNISTDVVLPAASLDEAPCSPKMLRSAHSTQPFDTASSARSESPSAGHRAVRKRPKHRPAYHARSKSDNRGVVSNNGLIFSPRPYEDLFGERAYLSLLLQGQSNRTADLIHQYSATEERFLVESGKQRRLLRKRLASLKSQINFAVEQEKAVLLRLGELYVEMQSRETWAQAGQQRMSLVDNSSSVCSPSIMSVDTPMSAASVTSYGFPVPTTPLNGATPEFVPLGYPPEKVPAVVACSSTELSSLDGVLDTVDECVDEDEAGGATYKPGQDDDQEAETSEETGDEKRVPCGMGITAKETNRRFSLPCLYNSWPGM